VSDRGLVESPGSVTDHVDSVGFAVGVGVDVDVVDVVDAVDAVVDDGVVVDAVYAVDAGAAVVDDGATVVDVVVIVGAEGGTIVAEVIDRIGGIAGAWNNRGHGGPAL